MIAHENALLCSICIILTVVYCSEGKTRFKLVDGKEES